VVPIHFSGGKADNYVPKYIFVIIFPCIMIFDLLYNKFLKNKNEENIIFDEVLLFIINLAIDIFTLIIT
jgi:hypothetical protein